MNLLPLAELLYIKDHLVSLGLHSLEEYWESEWWKMRKDYYFSSHPRSCSKCGESHFVQLHHKTYQHLGCEPDCDLTPLCKKCHRIEHRKWTRKIRKELNRKTPAVY